MVYALGTALALAAADFCVKLASGKLPNGVAVLLNGTFIFITGLGWVLWQRFRGVPQHTQLSGILAASGAGIAFGLVGLGLFATFEAGAPISVASPFIRLGGLLLASVAGLVLLHEAISWRYVLGMLLACSGVYLIVTR